MSAPAPDPPPNAERATLIVGGVPVAEYVWRPRLPLPLAPRPYLHPVRTLAGTPVTELMPTSHRHHLGASLAVADVDGANFWGGRTFVPGRGPVWLDNHGTQRHDAWLRRTPDELSHALSWLAADGTALLDERRTVSCRAAAGDGWSLDVSFVLRNATSGPVTIRSPAQSGRPGAGYGGFFWRAPAQAPKAWAFGQAGDRLTDLHGTAADWLAIAGATGGREWTLVFAALTEDTRSDPWFLRLRDYVGVGSCLAWARPLVLEPGQTVARRLTVVVADGIVEPARIPRLLAAAGVAR